MGLFSSIGSALTSNPIGAASGIVGIAQSATNFVGGIADKQGKATALIPGLLGGTTQLPLPKSASNFLQQISANQPRTNLLSNFTNVMTPQQGTSFLQGGFNANVSGAAGTPGSPISNRTSIVQGIFDIIFSPIGLLVIIGFIAYKLFFQKKK